MTTIDVELEEMPVKVGEMTVTPDYFDKNPDAPASTHTFDYEEIRRAPGAAEDALRAIQSVTGVSSIFDMDAALIVRGGNSDENLTLIDNIEIYNPFHFSRVGAGQGGLSIINPEIIRKVDFSTGGFPAKHSDRLSSVYEIAVKDGNRIGFAGDTYLNFGGFGGVFDGPLSTNCSDLVTVRRGYFDILLDLLEDNPPLVRYYDAFGKVTWEPNSKHKLSFVSFFFQDDLSEALTERDQNYPDESRVQKRIVDALSLGSNWLYSLNHHGYTQVTTYWASNRFKSNKGPEYNPNKYVSDSRENEAALKGELTYQFSKQTEIKAGISGKFIDGKELHKADDDTLQTGTVIPAYRKDFSTDGSLLKGGAFVQFKQRLWNRGTTNVGIRYDYFDHNKENSLGPRLSISWHVTDKTVITGLYGHYYQTPALYKIAMQPTNEKIRSLLHMHNWEMKIS